MVNLREINIDNFWQVIKLQVKKEQEEFLVSNAISIAQAKVQPELIPLAVYDDDTLIGFTMYCVDRDDNEYWLYRLMIDENYQGKGYGKKAMQCVIETVKTDKTRHKIYLGVHRGSIAAVRVYESFGFKFDVQVFGSEHIMMSEY